MYVMIEKKLKKKIIIGGYLMYVYIWIVTVGRCLVWEKKFTSHPFIVLLMITFSNIVILKACYLTDHSFPDCDDDDERKNQSLKCTVPFVLLLQLGVTGQIQLA